MDRVKNVEQLAFVLVNTLYLDVIKCINWNHYASLFFDPGCKTNFILCLDSCKFLDKLWVFFVDTKLA